MNGVCTSITPRSTAGSNAKPRSWKNVLGRISAACNDSWRVDETYIKIKKTWMYLYRAVDSEGNTLEFLLSPTRDAEAAKRFFVSALGRPTSTAAQASASEPQREQFPRTDAPNAAEAAPRVINVDKNAAYPKAIADLKAMGIVSENVELTSWSSISTTSSNKIIASSNGWSNQDWASSHLKRHGEHYRDTRQCI